MRLIDADDVDNHIVGSVNLSGCPTINAIPIPEDATNGDAIKAMFPNTTIFVDETHNVVWFELYHDKYDDDFDIDITFTLDWWNAKYKVVE